MTKGFRTPGGQIERAGALLELPPLRGGSSNSKVRVPRTTGVLGVLKPTLWLSETAALRVSSWAAGDGPGAWPGRDGRATVYGGRGPDMRSGRSLERIGKAAREILPGVRGRRARAGRVRTGPLRNSTRHYRTVTALRNGNRVTKRLRRYQTATRPPGWLLEGLDGSGGALGACRRPWAPRGGPGGRAPRKAGQMSQLRPGPRGLLGGSRSWFILIQLFSRPPRAPGRAPVGLEDKPKTSPGRNRPWRALRGRKLTDNGSIGGPENAFDAPTARLR